MPRKSKSKLAETSVERHDRRSNELASAKIGKLLEGKDFASQEEADEFLSGNARGFKLMDVEYKFETALEEAQYIMWQAFGQKSRKRRISMAEEALKASPDCADAYVLLAEDHARNSKEKITYYRQGIEAGRRALGDKLTDDKTQFWKELVTRPYMRAVEGLAMILFETNELDEAINLWQELMRLNPSDNQGARLALAPALVEADRLEEAEGLFQAFKTDKVAHLMYSRALCEFKKHGDSRIANDALEFAILANKHVLELFTDSIEQTVYDANSFTPGSIGEAENYLYYGVVGWIETDGAFEWISSLLKRELQNLTLNHTFPGLRAGLDSGIVKPFRMLDT